MEKNKSKHNRHTVKINGVKIVNAENVKKQQEPPEKSPVDITGSPTWLTEKNKEM